MRERRALNAQIAARSREAAGALSLSDLSERLDIHPETLRRYLNGRSRIPAWFIARIAECLDVPADRLLYDREPPRGLRSQREPDG